MGKEPSFQFYGGDYLKDPGVRSVSLAARGLWTDMLCMMDQMPERGTLRHGSGKPVTVEQLARLAGESRDIVGTLLGELEDAGVFSRDPDGAIYSRRMRKDHAERERWKESKRLHRGSRECPADVPVRSADSPGLSSSSISPPHKEEPAPLRHDCQWFRMTDAELEQARGRYSKKKYPADLLKFAVEDVDNWLTVGPSDAAMRARDMPSHFGLLFSRRTIEGAHERRRLAAPGQNGAGTRPNHGAYRVLNPAEQSKAADVVREFGAEPKTMERKP